ncbi:hypothetical protein [Sphingomonas crusticola]|uniref:hypothetical protein n=1 Tax=Sphingomonas crusticola TaxID=1697973 RepID=UPI000E234C72|nr:hypothetical protein [Sphingomonas crusticola]
MYSESDIEAAVASGAITPAAAAALRESVAQASSTSSVDEESFRLITGFNDIFVTIAAILLLVAIGWIGFTVAVPQEWSGSDEESARRLAHGLLVAGALVAAASWGLAEYFTRKRRMALPSIILLGTFVYATAAALGGALGSVFSLANNDRVGSVVFAAIGLLTAGAAWLHWRRFHVPITIAALTGALVFALVSLFMAAFPAARDYWLWIMLLGGLSVFAFAMWWDMSDRQRQTRRSDVAFWLHLSAAPMIAHPVFNLLGVFDGQIGAAKAFVVLILYVAFGIIALAVDRRALLVSSLIYVLSALAELFRQAGAVSLNIALTALVIGSALLLLSAFWHNVRRMVVTALPEDLQARLPALDRAVVVTPRAAI